MKTVPGLHRVPGDTRVVAACASRYDAREAAPLRGVRDAHAVASVLKLYLDALPAPLLRAATDPDGTGDAAGPAPVAAIAETRRARGRDAALAALRAFVATRLPARNRDALRATCAHLARAARAEAEFSAAAERMAAAFGKTFCGESTGSVEARSVVELLVTHHDSVFGRPAASVRSTTTTKATTTSVREEEKENASSRASEKARDDDGELTRVGENLDVATLELVRAFFEGDDGVCAEADRALGGSIRSLYASDAEDVEAMSVEALRREKTAIKRRLRAFDVSVERWSGARSTKEDKRHLRPLYLRLARVKRRMQIEHIGEGAARHSRA